MSSFYKHLRYGIKYNKTDTLIDDLLIAKSMREYKDEEISFEDRCRIYQARVRLIGDIKYNEDSRGKYF